MIATRLTSTVLMACAASWCGVESAGEARADDKLADAMRSAVIDRDYRAIRRLEAQGGSLTIDQAAELGDLDRVLAMLKKNPQLAKPPNNPVFWAAECGDLEMVRLLLACGADCDTAVPASNVQNLTAFTNAINRSDDEIAVELVRCGASIHAASGKNSDDASREVFRWRGEKLIRAALDPKRFTAEDRSSAAKALARAAYAGDLPRVELLLSLGVDPNGSPEERAAALPSAASGARWNIVELLLQRGAKVDVYTAAALGRREAVMKALSADPNLIRSVEATTRDPLLYFAILSGDAVLIRDLLRRGADPNADRSPKYDRKIDGQPIVFDEGGKILDAATPHARPSAIDVLVEAAKPTKSQLLRAVRRALESQSWETAATLLKHVPIAGWTAKERADMLRAVFDTRLGDSIRSLLTEGPGAKARPTGEAVRFLISQGLDLNTPLGDHLLLDDVLGHGWKDVADWMLGKGARIGFETAIRLGRVNLVKQFVEKDASLPFREGAYRPVLGYYVLSPFEVAVALGDVEMVRTLARDHEKLRKASASPAGAAIWFGRVAVLDFLVEAGVDVTRIGSAGRPESTVMFAAKSAQPGVVRWLAAKKFDLEASFDNSLGTALHVCSNRYSDQRVATALIDDAESDRRRQRRLESLRLLLEAGAKTNARDSLGRTPLHVAAEEGDAEAVELLLKHGADPKAEEKLGATPLDSARCPRDGRGRRKDSERVIQLLKRAAGGKAG